MSKNKMKQQLNEQFIKMQKLAGIITENQLNEIQVTLSQTGKNLGTYNPEDGDLSEGFIDDCSVIGFLKDTQGEIDCLVFEGDDYVCILTIDAGYNTPSISVHDKSVLAEIKNRIKMSGEGKTKYSV